MFAGFRVKNFTLTQKIKRQEAEIARLRGVISWASGRLLDLGNVENALDTVWLFTGDYSAAVSR